MRRYGMKFTIRPKQNRSGGGMSVTAVDAREALDAAKSMRANGFTEVEIFDIHGKAYDLEELERITRAGEDAAGKS